MPLLCRYGEKKIIPTLGPTTEISIWSRDLVLLWATASSKRKLDFASKMILTRGNNITTVKTSQNNKLNPHSFFLLAYSFFPVYLCFKCVSQCQKINCLFFYPRFASTTGARNTLLINGSDTHPFFCFSTFQVNQFRWLSNFPTA